ncbi:hypothetical protein PG984_006712 [Apiospora sp. TS-2023a]
MESVRVLRPATMELSEMIAIILGITLPTLHIVGLMIWVTGVAPRIKANRDFRAWLDARYDDRSLRKLFLKFLEIPFWEFHCLGVIAYTTYAKVSLALRKRRERKEQRNANIELEEARPKVDDGEQSVLSEPPPSYQTRYT